MTLLNLVKIQTRNLTFIQLNNMVMKKLFAFLMSIMLLVGAYSCTCTNQNVEAVPVEEVEEVEDSTAVADTLAIGAVAAEEEVAL